jgi:hypothetical protein
MWHAYYQDNGSRLEHKDTVVYQVIYIINEPYKIRSVKYNRAKKTHVWEILEDFHLFFSSC